MSKLEDTLTLPLDEEQAMTACKGAVLACGWAVSEIGENRLVPKIGVGLIRNPSKIEVLVQPISESESSIVLRGRIVGVGPIQKKGLSGLMNQLRNAIEVEAQRQ